jgi:2-polyprenyl-3-methyl-5-hydroxy-6-metoxy-1,4-benzoquinol methylase
MANDMNMDTGKLEAFVGKVVSDLAGTMATYIASIGDRLGLFKDLAANGPANSTELAARVNVQERYAREWLRAMNSAGYLEFDSTTGQFGLPPEHASVFAQEGGLMFLAGAHEQIPAMWGPLEELIAAFQNGGGVKQSSYNQHFWNGMQRFTDTWFENLLLQVWLPAVPDVQAKLERGARVADVGCGSGRALVKLAQAFPNSRFTGFDIHEPVVSQAAEGAKEAAVSDHVGFEALDVARGLPGEYDLITTFDVIHDMADPSRVLQAFHQALAPDGTYLMLEWNCPETPEENIGPMATFQYGYSMMYCMTTSLAQGGVGLGNLGLPESKVQQMCQEAGFNKFRKLPIDSPLNSLYEIKA